MSKPRKPRRKPLNVDAVIAMASFRNEMRAMAADRAAFQRRNAVWRRITAKLALLVIVGGITTVLVAHAIAYGG